MTTQSPNGTAVHSPVVPPPEEIWQTTLHDLELQNKNFVKYLYDSALVQADVAAGMFTVQVRDGQALEWVAVRLKKTIQHTLAPIVGRPVDSIELLFTLPGQNGATIPKSSNGAAAPNGRVLHQPPPPPEPEWGGNRNGSIWHTHPDGYRGNLTTEEREAIMARRNEPDQTNGSVSENGTGGREKGSRKKENPDDQPITFRNTRKPKDPLTWHVKASHYAIRFWLPLLGMEAFTLLVVISSYHYEVEHLNRPAPSLTKLANKMGYSDTLALKGRKAYGVSDPRAARPGLLDRLREHNLCLHRTEGYGKGIRHFFDYLTKVEDLPLLTPRQVAKLSEADREEHKTWLKLHKVNVEAWAADERETDVDLIPDDALDLSMSGTWITGGNLSVSGT